MTDNIDTTVRAEDIEYNDVAAFHDKFNFVNGNRQVQLLSQAKLKERYECMLEEINEFKDAIPSNDIYSLADALIDLVYFAKGTAVMMGLPWEQLWDDVQRANMTKVRGVTKRGHAFDVTKPEGWVGPRTQDIINGTGFDITKFQSDRLVNGAIEFTDGQWKATQETVKVIDDSLCITDAPEVEDSTAKD